MIMLSGTILGVLMITVVLASYQGMRESVKQDMQKYGEPYILTYEKKIEQISYRGVPLLIDGGGQPEKLTKQQYKALRNNEDLHFIGISPRSIKAVSNKLDNKKLALVGIDFAEEKKMKPWWQVWGSWPKHKNEVLVGYDVAQKYNLYAGDALTLTLGDHEEVFKVAGYLHYTGHIDDSLIYSFATHPFFSDGIDFAEAVLPYKAVMKNNTVPRGWSWSKIESTIDERASIIHDISMITPYVFGVTTLLGAAIIFVTLISQTEERRKEFSLWRAIGFHRKLIIKLLILEVLTIALLGSTAGFVSGMIFANIFNGIMSEFHFFAFVSFNQAVLIFIAAIFISIVTAIYPISLALKQDPLKLLKTSG